MAKKELCEVSGRQVRLSDFAFAIASEKFGAVKVKKVPKPVPVELLKPKEEKVEPVVDVVVDPLPKMEITEEKVTREKPVRSRSTK